MPKCPCNKKGKQPLHPRGLGGRWTSCPDPDPPDDQGVEAHSVTEADDKPVTAGGLVIRELDPRPCTPEPSVSLTAGSQVGAIVVRPTNSASRSGAQLRSHPSPVRPTSPKDPRPPGPAWVTVESVSDEDAGRRPGRPSALGLRTRYDRMQEMSPKSEQQDSYFGNPAAQSTT